MSKSTRQTNSPPMASLLNTNTSAQNELFPSRLTPLRASASPWFPPVLPPTGGGNESEALRKIRHFLHIEPEALRAFRHFSPMQPEALRTLTLNFASAISPPNSLPPTAFPATIACCAEYLHLIRVRGMKSSRQRFAEFRE